MTPLEAAARAICRAEHILRIGNERTEEIDRRVEEYWKLHVSSARAAIEAIREPSKAMEEAGRREMGMDEWEGTASNVWRAMIDAALAEGETP